MRKINFIPLDVPFLCWLRDHLRQQAPATPPALEFHRAVEELISGQTASLLLERQDSDAPSPSDAGLVCGDLVIDPKSRQVLRGGEEIQLTPKEFDILFFLAENRGTVFTKEQIYQAVWNEAYYTTDSNIMAFIRKLRKKVEPDPDAPRYILTIWGIGYKFNDTL